eukprot:g3855.t1
MTSMFLTIQFLLLQMCTFGYGEDDTKEDTKRTSPLSVVIESVGQRSPAEFAPVEIHPEPYKETVLSLSEDPDIPERGCLQWKIELILPPNELERGRSHSETLETCEVGEHRLTHMFTHPGRYVVEVLDFTSGDVLADTLLRNQYVRREMHDLTKNEWKDYVDAVWTLRNVSSTEGRQRFNCPTGLDDYRDYDFFVLYHGFHSNNPHCDQLHFSMMQEFAHEAWIEKFERALQCVIPSTSLTFLDEFGERQKYGGTASQLMKSETWGPDYMGGRDNRKQVKEPYGYVTDGAFANFPLRQNRTGLCEHFAEQDQERCQQFIRKGFFANKDPTKSGLWALSPRPRDSYDFVSRKTGYLVGMEDQVTNLTFPSLNQFFQVLANENFRDVVKWIRSDKIHGHAHYWMSGQWEPKGRLMSAMLGNPLKKLLDRVASKDKGVRLRKKLDLADAMILWAWAQDTRARFDGCIRCNSNRCWCASDADTRGCFDGNLRTPFDSFDLVDGPGDPRSDWHEYINRTRGYLIQGRKKIVGCSMVRGGTFDRSPTANQDPLFYLHHGFTFAVLDYAKRNTKDALAKAPFFNLAKYTAHECFGNRLSDMTVFENLVPYDVGQQVGSALCYPKCRDNYYGIGPVCWEHCPKGWVDEGALCREDGSIKTIAKKSYGRGAGVPLVCSPDEDEDAALCYTKCKTGFYGVGPVCWRSCSSPDQTDGGAICCVDAAHCTQKIRDLCAGIPLAVAKAILSGGNWQDIVKAAIDAINSILGFIMPMCSKL